MREGQAGRFGRAELVGLLGVVALAALLRFLDLPTRGTWDADQGNDMLVLWRMVHEGRWPLLGPPTSIGDFHHGVMYYYLLAPAAFLSGADPLAVVACIALFGVGAVAVVWWLGREIGGPVAGLAAAGAMAVSASAIEESTFIWNPNIIALSSAVALAAAWRAWTSRRARWWVLAAVGQAVTMHGHVLGSVMIVPLAALLVADVRRRRGSPADPSGRRSVLAAALAGAVLIAVSYVPLLVHELSSGFAETRAALDFLAGGTSGESAPLAVRAVVVPLRVLSWPLTGLITTQPIAGLVAAGATAAVLAWRSVAAPAPERTAARWLAATLAWSAAALVVGARSLGSVVPNLPNDHYHAFLDPAVFVATGLGIAALARARAPFGAAAAVAGAAALLAVNIAIWPPREAADGGYPAAERAARRILEAIPDGRYRLAGLPELKNVEAYGFPLRRLGGRPAGPDDNGGVPLVIACDRYLESLIGAACGGPAEAALAERLGRGTGGTGGTGGTTPDERFDASARTVISIFR